MIKKLYNFKIIRYGVFGLIANGFGYCVYACFIYLSFSYVIASGVAFILSMLVSFLFNTKLVFKAKQTSMKYLFFYCSFYISLWLFGILILRILITHYFLSAYLAQVINLFISVIISFTFLNILFRRK